VLAVVLPASWLALSYWIERPSYVGTIARIALQDHHTNVTLADGSGKPFIILWVTPQTTVTDGTAWSRVPATSAALKVGQSVNVYGAGMFVMTSSPPQQSSFREIVITGAP
jgi:hypothetical protein